MAVDLLDSITHNRPSATVCENLRLCNTDAPSAFRSHLQATSNTILYTCSIRVTISCLHCPHVWIHYTRLFLVHKLMQCTLCWYSRLRNGPPQKFEKARLHRRDFTFNHCCNIQASIVCFSNLEMMGLTCDGICTGITHIGISQGSARSE